MEIVIERINQETTVLKNTNRKMRIFPGGIVTFSTGFVSFYDLKEGSGVEFFEVKQRGVSKMFFIKLDSPKSYELTKRHSGLKIANAALRNRLIEFFGINEGDKSVAVRACPELCEFSDDDKELKGFAYELKKV